ncbi:MAG: sulfur carrier protein ThiS adenylyltransferase ThiF [Desulfobacter sp.]|nr:MAG: sulfur carrier protein ThiS adenylyltransferase ThiF [Desulfobacter sp.]
MTIGIAGAGGIGSNVARHLVQSGMTRFKIVDFDRVEDANLDRQFYFTDQVGRPKVLCLEENLRRISPGIEVEAVVQRIMPGDCPSLFRGCGLVVEGFDHARAKKDLVEELAGQGIPVVSASGIAGREISGILIRKIGNCTIVGDFATDVDDAPLFPPKVAVIAAMMAGAAMDEINKGDNHDKNR